MHSRPDAHSTFPLPRVKSIPNAHTHSRPDAPSTFTLPHIKSVPDVEGVVPVSARVCDFDPRKTCLAELGRARKEGVCGGVGKLKKLGAQL